MGCVVAKHVPARVPFCAADQAQRRSAARAQDFLGQLLGQVTLLQLQRLLGGLIYQWACAPRLLYSSKRTDQLRGANCRGPAGPRPVDATTSMVQEQACSAPACRLPFPSKGRLAACVPAWLAALGFRV